MPVIDGVKVACIPCIRGHRSTKCTHQSERVMIPVRKPGRPLSSCPHQKGKPCNCNNITAAIPRNGKCGCGTLEPINTNTKAIVKTEHSASELPPTSPTKISSFRVQKHTTPKSPTRKQSYDFSHLDQMDPSALNVMPSHNLSIRANGGVRPGSMPSPGFMPSNFQSHFGPGEFLAPHLEYPNMLERLDETTLNKFFENAVPDPSSNGLLGNKISNHSNITAGPLQHTPTPTSANSGSCAKGGPAGNTSCCGKGSAAMPQMHRQLEEQKPPVGLRRYGNPVTTTSDMSAINYNGGMNTRPMMQQAQQSPIYHYPAQYGSSFYEPLEYAQWERFNNQVQSMPLPPQSPYPAQHPPRLDTIAAMSNSYTANQCGCGEGCQCVGCATHPFNSTMQEYVFSVTQDEQSTSPSLSNGDNNGISNGTNGASPSILPSPIAEPSPASETGEAGMSDYLFVSYCPGSPQSCPCGDECACVGCMIHCQQPRTPVTPPLNGV
ncbi:hypothetical protein F4808DRAFT_470099 [Astrocystis sublimbata]|nr:hypothetical protein F4808DRAFT_470099 [Astrocystis sublimbata]